MIHTISFERCTRFISRTIHSAQLLEMSASLFFSSNTTSKVKEILLADTACRSTPARHAANLFPRTKTSQRVNEELKTINITNQTHNYSFFRPFLNHCAYILIRMKYVSITNAQKISTDPN